jgi:type I restriction enzyme, R subunit
VRRLHDLLNSEKELDDLIARDESATLEFKSSLRTAVGPPRTDDKLGPKELQKAVELSVVKTIAAFLNTKGGTLVIGVADDKTIVGIEVDYARTLQSSDAWRRKLDELISQQLGTAVLRSIDVRLAPYRGKTVAVIDCQQRDQPTWLDDELFVRRTASTVSLNTKQAWTWFQRWKRST